MSRRSSVWCAAMLTGVLAMIPRGVRAQAHRDAHGSAHGDDVHGATAMDSDAAAEDVYSTRHAHHHRVHVGIGETLLAVVSDSPTRVSRGVGLFAEVVLVPGVLEVELAARVATTGEGFEIPVDLVFKLPVHVTHWLHAFIGVGPTVVPFFRPGENGVSYGGATTIGAHFWLANHIALVVAADYNFIYEQRWIHEIGATAGLLHAW